MVLSEISKLVRKCGVIIKVFKRENQFFGIRDWQLKKHYYPDTPVQDFCRTFYPSIQLIENNKINENVDGSLSPWRFDTDVAYHFDATKFANWLREKYCIPRGVKHIRDDVKKVIVDDDGVYIRYIHTTFNDISTNQHIISFFNKI